ncbi:uncharacterized protein LOC108736775 [Agrilus planipennis]|uniref:Uncharacterized protein LOC108736775 n=1 Tax=Agrilus planipennis TaxID=224129 RepID=A0A1W4WXH5_AGRPL|nr:uncharacterized protein LOC108736775 [Agrilus planipennis]
MAEGQGKGNVSLSQTNPEVFTAEPRPGGYVKATKTFADDSSSSESSSKVSKIGSTGSRCTCKATNAPESTDDGVMTPSYLLLKKLSQSRVSEDPCKIPTDCSLDESSSRPLDPKIQSTKMLAITISCVMLLASQADVSLENLTIAESYLDCMRDENGDYPPNIEGILKKICDLKKNKSPQEDTLPKAVESTPCDRRVEFKKAECPKQKKIVPKVSKAQKYSHKK